MHEMFKTVWRYFFAYRFFCNIHIRRTCCCVVAVRSEQMREIVIQQLIHEFRVLVERSEIVTVELHQHIAVQYLIDTFLACKVQISFRVSEYQQYIGEYAANKAAELFYKSVRKSFIGYRLYIISLDLHQQATLCKEPLRRT